MSHAKLKDLGDRVPEYYLKKGETEAKLTYRVSNALITIICLGAIFALANGIDKIFP